MTPRAALETVLSPEAAAEVIQHRQKLKFALTDLAMTRLVNEFAKMADPDAAARMMCDRGWRGFKASWDTHKLPIKSIQQERQLELVAADHASQPQARPEPSPEQRQRNAERLAKLAADLARQKSPVDKRYLAEQRRLKEKSERIRAELRHRGAGELEV